VLPKALATIYMLQTLQQLTASQFQRKYKSVLNKIHDMVPQQNIKFSQVIHQLD
jgi:hypothetical protein